LAEIFEKTLKIEFSCFSFMFIGLLFVNFSAFKPHTENNANFDAESNESTFKIYLA